ncbi:hypothetical protein GCM10010411_18250 [Actinomadura fulvescens]|uniref:Uncharacterized protein n=1 Tax=Actinomadura fulvescens TaxID=46160 RepID=A0ABN3PHB7_9ACTN
MFWSLLVAVLPRLLGMADTGGGLLTLATVTVAALLLLAAAQIPAARRHSRASLARVRTTLRERTLRTAFLPQRDPDAAGRPRPRAPGLKITLAR